MSHKLLLTVVLELDVPGGTTPRQLYDVLQAVEGAAMTKAEQNIVGNVGLYSSEIECDCGSLMDEDNDNQMVTCSECEVFS